MTKSKDRSSSKERYLWITLFALMLALVVVLSLQYIGCRDRLQEAEREREALLATIDELKGGSLLRSWEVSQLQKEGLSDPADDLAADLVQHRELIPFEGVLGGTMGFYSKKDIHVLTSRWVLASFEDGHIGGCMLLEYTVSPQGKIQWKVLTAYLD